MRALHAHAKAFAFILFLGLAAAQAALPPNTPIVNTASATFRISGVPVTVTGSATLSTSAGTPATIGLLAAADGVPNLPAGTGSTLNVAPTQCQRAAGWVALNAPTAPGQGPLAVPGDHKVVPASTYASGDLVLVQVTDHDQNADPAVRETLVVTVGSEGGDSERLRLTETGPSTGIFLGYLQTAHGAAQPGNCVLEANGSQRITASYVDQSENSVVISATALVDPFGIVFDSATGAPVSGVRVTMVDVATGQPAAVFGNDGVSAFPSTVLTGATVTDAGGETYAFAPGRFQFPRVAPGNYRFTLELPAGYRAPSRVPDATLQALPGGPFVIVAGSRGEVFTVVAGPALEIDIPVDPGPLGELAITKSAGKAVAAIGDFVPYTLAISSRTAAALSDVLVADRLPPGFRYQPGSARLDGQPLAEPVVAADGRTLQFTLPGLAANASVSLRYVAAISPGARLGPAENTAQAVGRVSSNVARATVTVRDDLNRTRAILMGRVTLAQSCEQDEREPGAVRPLAGVRLVLQDGTTVLTDAEGNWHAENLRPGTHVVQVDTTTLPPGMELRNCDRTSSTGGRDFSRLVNVRGGSLWRADFRLVRTATCIDQRLRREGNGIELALGARPGLHAVTATVLLPQGAKVVPQSARLDGQASPAVQVEDGFVVLRLPAQPAGWQRRLTFTLEGGAGDLQAMVRAQPEPGQAPAALQPLVLQAQEPAVQACVPVPAAAAGATQQQATAGNAAPATPQLVEVLPFDDKWLASAEVGNEWLHPRAGFNPALQVVKVAIKHVRGSVAELRVNGAPVDALRYEGAVLNPAGTLMLSTWKAVDLRDGPNVLEVAVRGDAGQVLLQESRTLHYAVGPASVRLEAQRSRLVADGRAPPVIAVRLLDREGKPVRRGVTGEVAIVPPYLPQQTAELLQQDPLTLPLGAGRARFEVGEDGVAAIALQPTQQSGEAVLRFDFGDQRQHEVRAWLEADLREWILVGFAEGTLGHKRLAGNLQALRDSGAGEHLFDQDRVAFYAKGTIKGEYLLTLAYDSAKEKASGHDRVLKQQIDPNQYYTLYGDASQPQYDAASTGKLYLRIEKKQFYALFGDYDTGLTVTELGRYSRSLTGLKSGYQGETFSYQVFAARTRQGFMRDELQGDGTSGLYRLRARNIVGGTEKVRIEVRDRFQPDVVRSTRALVPWLDYQVDRDAGTLLMREPVPSRDPSLDPVFIVVEYETEDPGQAGWTYGGRVAAKLAPGAEAGVTHLHEGNTGREGRLTAADATLKLGETTKLRAEVATSRSETAAGPRSGQAYLVEATHDDGKTAARAYASQQDPGFGLGQQAAAATGQRKVGADARHKLNDKVQLQAEAYRQEDLAGGGERKVGETRLQWADKEAGLTASAGVRAASETDGAGREGEARQVTGAVAYEVLDGQVVLRAATDLDVGSRGTVNFPNRLLLGIDYRITPETILFATHEIARGDALRADTTRVGLRTALWSGAEFQLGAGNQQALDAGRLFASMGLVQRLKIDEHWSADFGVDRVQTLRSSANPLGPDQPLASGTPPSASYGILTGDHTALALGLAYTDADWSGTARVEWRDGDDGDKLNLLAGVQRKLGQGRIAAAGLTWLQSEGAGGDMRQVNLRVSHAWRPAESRWAWLQRLEYVEERNGNLAARLFTRKLIANFNANWKASPRTQVAMQYSGKYVREMLGDTSHAGYTDLWGLEARHELGDRWDVGVHAGMLTSWRLHARSYQLGLSVGYRLAENTWVAVGYNHLGFTDADFAGAEYRAQGVYVNLRMKFDQDTFNLNDRKSGLANLKP